MKLGRYSFHCSMADGCRIPRYKGSVFRGAFGHALKKVCCAVRIKDCLACLLSERCIYSKVFELRPHRSDNGRPRVAAPPHPYVIEPPLDTDTELTQGKNFDFNLLLFGAVNEYLPYFIYAVEQMGGQGIGRRADGKRARFKLKKVTAQGKVVYLQGEERIRSIPPTSELVLSEPHPANGTLTLELTTPLRMKWSNRYQADLPFHLLARAMLRRISSLFAAHDNGEPALDYKALVARSHEVKTVESRLRWLDIRRYSNRQEQALLMGGMVGNVTYQGDLGEYLPLMEVSRAVHLGKQTSFGLGKIDFTWQGEIR